MLKVKHTIFLTILLWLLVTIAHGQNENWRKIIAAESTKEDVERILGKPEVDKGYYTSYDLKFGRLSIDYSIDFFCKPNQDYWWNLAPGVVREIKLFFYNEPKYKSLKINRKKFKKTIEGDVLDHITYINEEEGVKYLVVPKGLVESVTYFPSKKYDAIRCSNLNQ